MKATIHINGKSVTIQGTEKEVIEAVRRLTRDEPQPNPLLIPYEPLPYPVVPYPQSPYRRYAPYWHETEPYWRPNGPICTDTPLDLPPSTICLRPQALASINQ